MATSMRFMETPGGDIPSRADAAGVARARQSARNVAHRSSTSLFAADPRGGRRARPGARYRVMPKRSSPKARIALPRIKA